MKHIYAEEGRYYLPKKSLRSDNGSSTHSHPNSAPMSAANDKMSLNAKMSNGRTSNKSNNSKSIHGEKNVNLASNKKSKEMELHEKQNQPNQAPQAKKKEGGCCLIS